MPDPIGLAVLGSTGSIGRQTLDAVVANPDRFQVQGLLVTKAFEAVEAKWLYGIPYPRIDAVIHPTSVVHSLVEFVDGSFNADIRSTWGSELRLEARA